MLAKIKHQAARLAGDVFGYDIQGLGGRNFVAIERSHPERVWFSQRTLIKRVLEAQNIQVVLDVGANVGQFASSVRQVWPGEIHSFEPVADVFRTLASCAASDDNWHVHNLALGDKDGTATIGVSAESVFTSILPVNEFCAGRFGSNATTRREETIIVRRLDSVLKEIVPGIAGKRIFLKMDTQGYDNLVFAGLGEVQSLVFGLQAEVSHIPIYAGMPHWTESLRIYEEAGFHVAGMFPVSWAGLAVVEHDCVLVRGIR